MQRYFAEIINNRVKLDDGDVHHLLNVVRMKKGEQIEVVSNAKLYICEINNTNPLDISVVEEAPLDSEISNEVTLFFALAKGDKIDFVIQKATELGAKRIVLMKTNRCVVKLDEKDFAKKLVRYQKIAKEASEQSHRLVVPEIVGVVDINKIPDSLMSDINYIAYEKEAGTTEATFNELNNIGNKSVSIFIGPEGGFTEEEVDILNKRNVKSVSLGKRILRCETAAVYALSIIGFMLEK